MAEVEKRDQQEIIETDARTQRINAKYRAFERDFRSAAEHAIQCGELLMEQKASLNHGEWRPWLRESFQGSERHAQRFMKLAREQGAIDPTRVSDLSFRGALRELPKRSDNSETLPSLADEIVNEYVMSTEEEEWFTALPEKEKAVYLRNCLITKYMFLSNDDAYPRQKKHAEKVVGHLDRLEAEVRPIDLPADSGDREFCEGSLTYRQMHQPIAELSNAGIIGRAPSEEVFENFLSSIGPP